MYTCRECEAEINQATELCPHCGADLTVAPGGEPLPVAKPPLYKAVLRWGVLLAVLLGAMWSFLWFVVTPRTGRQIVDAEASAVQAIHEIHTALAGYAAAQGGVFPSTLDPLGPVIRPAAQMAQSDGYQLRYTPGPPGGDGSIRTYSLEAIAGNYGYRSFYMDSSGTIRATRENRPATSLDPPIQ